MKKDYPKKSFLLTSWTAIQYSNKLCGYYSSPMSFDKEPEKLTNLYLKDL